MKARERKPHTEESKRKMSKSHKGLVFTDEHKENLSNSAKGRKHTEKTKENTKAKEDVRFALIGSVEWFEKLKNALEEEQSQLSQNSEKWQVYKTKIDARPRIIDSTDEEVYDTLVKEAGKSYSDANVVKSPAVRIGKGPIDPGTGLSSTGSSMIKVNLKGNPIGRAKFGEVVNDLNGFDWGSNIDRVTVNGITKDVYDKSGNNYNNLGKAAIEKLVEDSHKSKSSLSTFKLKVAPIAAGNSDFSAVVITPNVEWIKANTAKTKTVNGKTVVTEPGLFMPSQAEAVLKNGISYIMDSRKMNNSMYKSSYQSPIEAYVDYYNKPYELNSIGGDPMKSFKVEKNKIGTGDYTVTITYPQYNPDKGIMEKVPYRANYGYMGENLTNMRDRIVNGFMDDVDFQSTLDYNNFQKANQ
jgi:hypothetical protein